MSKQYPLLEVKCGVCGLEWQLHGMTEPYHCPILNGNSFIGLSDKIFRSMEYEGLLDNTRFERIE